MRKKSQEDFLRTIFVLSEKIGDYFAGVRPVDIAEYLKISKSAVCQMIEKLTKERLVKTKPYSSVFLTEKGFKIAKRITHNHRVIEVFLKDVLNCDLDRIHEEAHQLEHTFSEYTIKKLDKFLGNPKVSPMGKKIPHNKISRGNKK